MTISEPATHPRSDLPDAAVLRLRVGRTAAVRVRFVEAEGRLWVIPTATPCPWAHAAVSGGACAVRRGSGRWSLCSVRRRGTREDLAAAEAAFRAKYGNGLWERHFSSATTLLELTPGGTPTPASAVAQIQEEFDGAADRYASRLAQQPVERALKARTLAVLRVALRGLDPLLEIGPGIGVETLPFLADGHNVTAVDLSPRMLSVLASRAAAAGVSQRLSQRLGSLGDLATALGDAEDGAFGGAYSTFGAFSLEPDVSRVGAALGRLLRPGGRLVFTTLNRPSPAAIGWELALGRARAAGARLRPTIPPGRVRYPLAVHLRRASEWDARLEPWFARREVLPVSVVAPPFEPGLGAGLLRGPGAARLARWDAWLSRRRWLSEFGEWSILEYERRPEGHASGPASPPKPR
jgi:SAM-dependent methyltransferase